jgi:hypothetical protein
MLAGALLLIAKRYRRVPPGKALVLTPPRGIVVVRRGSGASFRCANVA